MGIPNLLAEFNYWEILNSLTLQTPYEADWRGSGDTEAGDQIDCM